jgi:predicted MFS family arabinose efflux permease
MEISTKEIRAVTVISMIMGLRLLGIFFILPVFSAYTINYPGATLTLTGIAFGVYALSQSLLQIPFGWASDIFGRKPIIIIGLLLFSLGSFLCAMAGSINQLILARAIQGSGAIGAVAIAALGDSTRPQVRAEAFTITSIIIGGSFIIGLIGGPFIAAKLGFKSLFYTLTFLGLIALTATLYSFPKIDDHRENRQKTSISALIKEIELQKIYFASFVNSLIINFFLFIYPLSWISLGVEKLHLWKIYLIILLPSVLIIFPYIRYAEKKGKLKLPTRAGWAILLISYLLYLFAGSRNWMLLLTGIALFFGYTLYQSVLPAFLTTRATPSSRGAASGVYNLSNFFGASLGGMLVGYLYHISQYIPLVIGLLIILVWGFIGLPNQPSKMND